jgi:hypothetical protein
MKFGNCFALLKKYWLVCTVYFVSCFYIIGVAIFSPQTLTLIKPFISVLIAIPAISVLANLLFSTYNNWLKSGVLVVKGNQFAMYLSIGIIITAFLMAFSASTLYCSIYYGIASLLMFLLFLKTNED